MTERPTRLRSELQARVSSLVPASSETLEKASWEMLQLLELIEGGIIETDRVNVIVHSAEEPADGHPLAVSYQTVRDTDLMSLLEADETEYLELDYPGELELDVSSVAIGVRELSEKRDLAGRDVIVAVLDDEVVEHPGLVPRVVWKGNHSGLDWGETSFVSNPAHATMVAGIIAGTGAGSSPEKLLRGVAPEAVIWNYRINPLQKTTAGSYTSRGVVDAILAAVDDGAHVVNLSWGKPIMEPNAKSDLCKAVQYAEEHGVLVVKSAGNKGERTRPNITTPADSPFALVVGMTSNDGVEVMPGSSCGLTTFGLPRPDLLAPGAAIHGPAIDGTYILSDDAGFTGTSFAAPHIAGAAALVIEAFPGISPEDCRRILMESCRPLGEIEPIRQGRGIVQLAAVPLPEPPSPELPSPEPPSPEQATRRVR